MTTDPQWLDIKRQVDKICADINPYWTRPNITPPATTAVDNIITGNQPLPRGWHQPKGHQ